MYLVSKLDGKFFFTFSMQTWLSFETKEWASSRKTRETKRGLLRTPGRRSKFLYYELRTKANLVSGRWWWSNSSGPHGKKQQQTHFVVSVYTIMGEQKTQDHLKTQDASTVDASKLTALTPEVVRANSWCPSLNPTITKSLHFLPLDPVLCLFFFL